MPQRRGQRPSTTLRRLKREKAALLQLTTDFTAGIRCTVHVDVQVTGLEAHHLRFGQLGAGRSRISVAFLRKRHNHWAVLARGAVVNVRSRAGDARRADATRDRAVVADRDSAATVGGRRHRRNLVRAGQRHVDVCTRSWRKVVSTAVRKGIPVPAFSTALAFFDGLRSERLPANLLQAQRDYFGAHTYERVDKPRGEFFHTNWTGTGGRVASSTYTV
jgi:hypothetical protein